MHRREFLAAMVGTAVVQAGPFASATADEFAGDVASMISASASATAHAQANGCGSADPARKWTRRDDIASQGYGLHELFLFAGRLSGQDDAGTRAAVKGLLNKYELVATCAEVVRPEPLVWDFVNGPATIGLVPRATRQARIDALKQTSDFAKLMGIPQVQTHCGFIPEDPKDALYEETVLAIRQVAKYCAANGQNFLMETGQETPTTLLRAIKDVDVPTLGVGLDTANLILYGKANPADAVEIIGPYVRSVHAKDGKWPTDPMKLGEEVLIGSGYVDFKRVFTRLYQLGYEGAITIERETSGPQQVEDVKNEKVYLEKIIANVLSSHS